MNYARSLLLQRGRDAGGIASELVDLIEEEGNALTEVELELSEAKEDIDSEKEDLRDEIRGLEKERDSYDASSAKHHSWARKLASALHEALRKSDLVTVQNCRELLEEFKKEYPEACGGNL